jgi:hypothetical protein
MAMRCDREVWWSESTVFLDLTCEAACAFYRSTDVLDLDGSALRFPTKDAATQGPLENPKDIDDEELMLWETGKGAS